MRRWAIAIAVLLAAYLATGFYIVRGNEQATVRRFGRLLRTETDVVALRASGLHYDLPWPFSRIDRVNLNEFRTLSIGAPQMQDIQGGGFLQSIDAATRSQFLTGDKNILHLQINVQYRIAESGVDDFLYRSESAERRLQRLAESIAADLVSRSGVDFVHPLGLGELRDMLTSRTRRSAAESGLGIDVEEVAINAVYPPVQVKSYFLDVSNARADKQKYINAANAYAEQQLAAANAEARRILDDAESYRQQSISAAHGSADSFAKIIEQFQREESQEIHSYAAARDMSMRRLYIETLEDIFRDLAGKVFLDSGKPVDLTIFRDPQE